MFADSFRKRCRESEAEEAKVIGTTEEMEDRATYRTSSRTSKVSMHIRNNT